MLTLWQPYATLIARRVKHWETRGWSPRYRGDVAIHASARRTRSVRADVAAVNLVLAEYDVPTLDFEALPFAAVVAVVRVASHTPHMRPPPGLQGRLGWFGEGRFAWKLEDVRPLDPPIPWTGQPRLEDAPAGLVAMILRSLESRETASL